MLEFPLTAALSTSPTIISYNHLQDNQETPYPHRMQSA